MWTRKELKERGKAAFKANYWRSVLVGVILTVLVGSGYASAGRYTSVNLQEQSEEVDFAATREKVLNDGELSEEDRQNALTILDKAEVLNNWAESDGDVDELWNGLGLTPLQGEAILGGLLAGIGMVLLIFKLLDIFLLNPLEVGCQNFFIQNSRSSAMVGEVGRAFSPAWINNVITLLLRDIFLGLWFCLLIVPGVIKLYSYRMVPYILADHPEMGPIEAITRSREMMNGHKWNTFVLDLSFLGWDFLTAITCGIVGVFWTQPYKYNTYAALYEELS